MHDGKVTFKGEELDFSQILKEKRRAVARAIADGVLAAWGDRAGFISKVYLAGGGALELPELAGMLSNAKVIDDAQFANALGFLKFGES